MHPTCPAPFRQGVCPCGIVFFVCSACERGQVYCSLPCREQARRAQCRAANLRHQQSPEGRLDHRDHQRRHRARHAERVTDHTYAAASAYATLAPPARAALRTPLLPVTRTLSPAWPGLVCHFCGRRGRWLNPFYERR